MSKHTPGPWMLEEEDHGDWIIRSANGKAFMGDTAYYPWQSDNIEDARLIASAPELLAALKAAMAFINSHVADPDITAEMSARWLELQVANPQAAIAKAEGR